MRCSSPVDCIHPTKDEVDFAQVPQLYINPNVCVDCDMCVDECPVKANFADDDVPQEFSEFIEINAAYFRK